MNMEAAVKREEEMPPLKTLVQQGRYEVDARRVAEAIVDRILDRAPAARAPQKECSKPSSWPTASTNTASG